MQFIKNGPDIPERLLQSHEDGKVVFFCGAGISFLTNLPSFSELANRLYEFIGEEPNKVQRAALKADQFDKAIELLELSIPRGREKVRKGLVPALSPDLTAQNATATHEALLTLSENRIGQTRLITTNFDRLFEEVIATKKLPVNCFKAPQLPILKNRWDGLVYLHGLLSKDPQPSELDSLVISSGDFGLAYLTERWAARFVSELFRNYTVCFIGYSINDHILRYMMDALAADRLLGESPPEMFAFGSFSKGKKEDRTDEWRAKNVTPILYREHNHHIYLHKTLRAWAETYRDGVQGKERIVIESAISLPLTSTKQDDFVGRMLWALSDPSGLPAKQFAKLNPVPSLEWLEPLSANHYDRRDLDRFGLTSVKLGNNDKFSLMTILDTVNVNSSWDDVMYQLADWLIRHLNDPKLLLWLTNRGGKLYDRIIYLIENRLDELAKLEHAGDTAKLARIHDNAPNGVPTPLMRTLWQLMITGRIKSSESRLDTYRWRNHFKLDGLTTSLRTVLREILTPRVAIREFFKLRKEDNQGAQLECIKDQLEWEVVLSEDYVHSSINYLSKDEGWVVALPALLGDFTRLLNDALDLMRELGDADDRRDNSCFYQPSISEHPQNTYDCEWTLLIYLTREAWLATVERSIERACLEAEVWWSIPYPLFRRLSFFAATHNNVIPSHKALQWLLADENWWLWSMRTERETMRLIVALAPNLNTLMQEKLEQAILVGPPRLMFREDLEPKRWQKIVDRKIWLRLAKIKNAGVSLGSLAENKLNKLSSQYPKWELASDQQDEFSLWIESVDETRSYVKSPRRRVELIEWLKKKPGGTRSQKDDWRQRCSDSFSTTACALYSLSTEAIWPVDRWKEALQTWSEDKLLKRSWRYMARVIVTAPDEILKDLSHSISWWLQALAKSFEGQEELFLDLANRVLSFDNEADVVSDDPMTNAINHPVGLIIRGLLSWWYRFHPEDNQGLPDELLDIFTKLSDTTKEQYRHGRFFLAMHAINLFRVAPDWSRENLLYLFNWNASKIEARSAWKGFLWSSRIYRPLMNEIKADFLDTAQHYGSLDKHDGRKCVFLITFVALDLGDIFTKTELRSAIRSLPQDGLLNSAEALLQALKGAGEQRANFWFNRVKPFFLSMWPKTKNYASPDIAKTFGLLCIAAGDVAFPDAFSTLKDWLQPIERPDRLIHKLHDAKLCTKFPVIALEFLHLVIGDGAWCPYDLKVCLDEIINAKQSLEGEPSYIRLRTYLRRHNRD